VTFQFWYRNTSPGRSLFHEWNRVLFYTWITIWHCIAQIYILLEQPSKWVTAFSVRKMETMEQKIQCMCQSKSLCVLKYQNVRHLKSLHTRTHVWCAKSMFKEQYWKANTQCIFPQWHSTAKWDRQSRYLNFISWCRVSKWFFL
jgi:hypothetical protein